MDNYQNYGTVNNEDSNDSDCDYLFGIQEKENINTVKSKQPKLKIMPFWLKANSECERFIETICMAMRAAHVEQKNWKQEMYNFLRNYRAT